MLPLALSSLCETTFWTRMRALYIAPLAATLLALSACGDGGGAILTPGGGGNNPPPACDATSCGDVVIGLTDAEGDFLSYAVDVVSIKLEKANGDTVQALPTRQRVDFADLVNVTEFVTSATIPNGDLRGRDGAPRLQRRRGERRGRGHSDPGLGRGREWRFPRCRGRPAPAREREPHRGRAGHARPCSSSTSTSPRRTW